MDDSKDVDGSVRESCYSRGLVTSTLATDPRRNPEAVREMSSLA